MPKPSSSLIESIYKMAGVHRDDTRSDAELLKRYADNHDEQAFSALMVRHGGMVWAICRRMLRSTEDVEEAYQSTFLALADKANRVSVNVVGWLHQVAHRTALAARRDAKLRRRLHEGLKELVGQKILPESNPSEVYEALHAEIAKLPEKQRVVLVLHYLEGKTQGEVAKILGVEESAIWHRLARGKALLEQGLRQSGLVISGVTVSSLLEKAASNAAMPPGLVSKTVKAAAAFRDGKLSGGLANLAKEVMMHAPATAPWWKTGWMITILCVTGLSVGAGGIAWKADFFRIRAKAPPTTTKKQTPQPPDQEKPKQPQLDLYGDPLPAGALARLGTLRFRSSMGLESLIFTPNGKAIITAGDAPARLWNLATGELVHQFGESQTVALSADGYTLVGCDKEKRLTLWDTSSGKLIRRLKDEVVAIAPDGKTMITFLRDGPRGNSESLSLCETTTGKARWKTRRAPGLNVSSSIDAYSSDSKTFISTEGRRLIVWDVATGKRICQWSPSVDNAKQTRGNDYLYTRSPDGRLLAVIVPQDRKRLLYLVDAVTGKELRRWTGEAWDYSAIAISPDNTVLAMGDCGVCGGTIHFWNTATGEELHRCEGGLSDNAQLLTFSPNGKVLAAGVCNEGSMQSSLRLWDVASGREIRLPCDGHRSEVRSVTFSADGRQVISSEWGGGVRVWDAATGVERHQFRPADGNIGLTSHVRSVISPDNNKMAFIFYHTKNKGSIVFSEALASIRDNHSWKELHRFSLGLPTEGFLKIPPSFSLDGARLYCKSEEEGWLDLWDVARGKKLRKISGCCGTFSPDGKFFATIVPSRGGAVVLWDAATGREIGFTSGRFNPKSPVNGQSLTLDGLSFTPDGLMLVAEYGRERITKYLILSPISLEKNSQAIVSNLSSKDRIIKVGDTRIWSISPDCSTLAWADDAGVIHLREIASGNDRCCFQGDAGVVRSVAFSSDSRRLAAGYKNTTLLVWDATGRLERGKLRPARISDQTVVLLSIDLASTNAERAGRAIWALAAAPTQTVPFFKGRLALTDPNKLFALDQALEHRMVQWIAQLDNDQFQVRRQAEAELKKMGHVVALPLRQALKARLSADARSRIKSIVKELGEDVNCPASPKELYSIRAIEVLTQIGTAEARLVLQRLADGTPTAARTQAAQRALCRLRQTK